jgi:pyruvate/2-oxoglutarate/acetoin dehydrogenase E1 component
MTYRAEEAAADLAARGIETEVVDLRTLCPLDVETLARSVRKTGRLLIVEEGCRTGGFSGEIAMRMIEEAFDYLDAPIRRVATPDVPLSASPVLERAALPDRRRIADAALELLEPN